MQRLLRQGVTATGEATTTGKRCQSPGPAGSLQMQRSDLFFRRTHISIGISKRLATQTLPHTRASQEPSTKPIQQRGNRHRPAGETCGSEEKQRTNPLRVTPGQLHSHRTTHGGTDHLDRLIPRQMFQQGIEVTKHWLRAIGHLQRTRGEAKAKQIRDEQLEMLHQQRSKTPPFQKAAVETMEQKQGRPLPQDGDRKRVRHSHRWQRPPLKLLSKKRRLRIEKIRAELVKKRFQDPTGLNSAAPTNASSKTPGVTWNGR